MELFYNIVDILNRNITLQYFLVGAFGSIMFDATLYFKRDLGVVAKRKHIGFMSGFGVSYLICQCAYSAIMGGVWALFINHAIWLAFVVGFFNSVFVTFVVKSMLINSMKKGLWIAIGRLLFEIIGAPTKKLILLLETVTSAEKNKDDTQ